MSDETADLTALVNASGFMLQLAIEHAVEATSDHHGFEVEAREHPWQRDGHAGFIDLILGRTTVRMVCECKRSRDAVWVFPVDQDRSQIDRARLHWIKQTNESRFLDGWDDFHLTTSSPESSFCMVRGKGENDSPLLERIAHKLILSVEALAAEEAGFINAKDGDDSRVYLPIVLTTASLWVCRYAPESIDIKTGMVSSPQYQQVPAIRFRKALTTYLDDQKWASREMPRDAFSRLSKERERTVLVINSESLVDILSSWEKSVIRDKRVPWDIT